MNTISKLVEDIDNDSITMFTRIIEASIGTQFHTHGKNIRQNQLGPIIADKIPPANETFLTTKHGSQDSHEKVSMASLCK